MINKQTSKNTPRRWYNIWQQSKTAEVYIYGDITSWPERESDVSSYSLTQEIAMLKDVENIDVYINSYGGDVSEGIAIYAALCRHPAKIVTHCDGFACSAASIIFMAGDERYISSLGQLMIHEAWNSGIGTAADFRKMADTLEQISQGAAEAYKSRVNISDDALAEMLAQETWFNAEQALAMGFATAIESWDDEAGGATMAGREAVMSLFARGLADSPRVSEQTTLDRKIMQLKVSEELKPREKQKTGPAQKAKKCFFSFEKK